MESYARHADRPRRAPRALLAVGCALALAACGDDPVGADAGGSDAGRAGDGGRVEPGDAGPGADDAGSTPDASAAPDGGDAADAAVADGGVDAGPIEPMAVLDSRCGLDFRWLPTADVGHLVSFDTPHSSLTTDEAAVVRLGLFSEGINFSRSPDYDTRAHRMVYTTQDRGVMREATALVIVPEVDASMTMPVILWHHGTTGLNDLCAPSYNIEDRDSEQYGVAAILSLLASYGYVIVAPDYLGQKSVGAASPSLHPYLVGEPTAIAALDAVDAARELAAMVTAPSFGRIAIYGASQGGHAGLFTAIYAPHYAPDLDIGAGVYVVPPTDLTAHMARGITSLSPPSGNAVLWLAGANDWYEPTAGLSDVLVSPYDTQVPVDAAADCSPNTFDGVVSTDEVFTAALRTGSAGGAVAAPSPWDCYAREASITLTDLAPPTIPGLVILSEDDTLVDTAIESAAFATLCGRGHDLAYLECRGANHTEGFFFSVDDALDFIDDQLAAPTSQACAVRAAERCSSEL